MEVVLAMVGIEVVDSTEVVMAGVSVVGAAVVGAVVGAG
eukprot:CAMPEP_0202715338 /NCGR_PEP_ID=MMETSP1385-20130828/88477_1 /ASSEMBLY_ACC=CAM_ASM_000861 /TAXON_ID=933848 /ORGANISM="Elphidium margaritaceum" /LENGTH=38 /DNA_ID= /DNA_START= /DNA_END= /DNA_ORIENTATION=